MLGIVTLLVIVSCDLTEIVTIEWQEDDTGFRQFSTNDVTKWGKNFIYVVHPMTDVAEVQIKKMSGYYKQGFGLVFCYQDSDNYYKLLIDVVGDYIVYQVEEGVSIPVISLSSSERLNTGYDMINTVMIQHDSGDPKRTYDIYFNGYWVADFKLEPYPPNGSVGYYASVAEDIYEYFPYVPVDVRYKLLQPLPVDPSP